MIPSKIDDFVLQIFPQLPTDRIRVFSCGHVVPADAVNVVALTEGPTGIEFDFTFEKRHDERMVGCARLLLVVADVVAS